VANRIGDNVVPRNPTFSGELHRAISYACVCANKRGKRQCDLEDLVIGLWQAQFRGWHVLFDHPGTLPELAAQILPDEVRAEDVTEAFWPEGLPQFPAERGDSGQVGYASRHFDQSVDMCLVLEHARKVALSKSRSNVSIENVVEALATSPEGESLARKYGIIFKKSTA
jgi:hypothetical protein